jgi:hypothetical protein
MKRQMVPIHFTSRLQEKREKAKKNKKILFVLSDCTFCSHLWGGERVPEGNSQQGEAAAAPPEAALKRTQ